MALRLSGVLLLLPAVLLFSAVQAQERPNFIVLFVDDLGYGDLGSYGSPDALTPHIDALAARGLRFTDFYAGGPVCTPSRYALLTGLHTFRAGDPRLFKALEPHMTTSGINSDAVTLAEVLRDGGYETAMIGKWHLGHGHMPQYGAADTEYHPLHHGFDSFFGSFMGMDYNTHWHENLFLDWWADRQPRPEDSLRYATNVFGERATAFLNARAGAGITRPSFFLYLPFTAPHAGKTPSGNPLVKTQLPIGREHEYLSRFDHLYTTDDDIESNIRKRYLAMVAVLDDVVGQILEALDRNGLTENTILWFLSDNGPDPRFGGSPGVLRGYKATPYEGGVRVPAFVTWKGQISPGTTAQLATNVDLLPTLLTLARLPLLHPVDGIDLSGHLRGGPGVARGVAVPNPRLGDAYRLGRWKLVRHYDGGGAPRPAELYDLDADPSEALNLAAVHPDTVAMLIARFPYGRPPGPDTLGVPTGREPSADAPVASLRVLSNPSTAGTAGVVEVMLPVGGPVRVETFDTLGRRLAVVYEGALSAGVHRWALPALPVGVVVVRAVGPFGTLSARATRRR